MPAKVIFPDVLLTTVAIVLCMDDHVDVVAAYRPYTRGEPYGDCRRNDLTILWWRRNRVLPVANDPILHFPGDPQE
jgi:hypothetical protein